MTNLNPKLKPETRSVIAVGYLFATTSSERAYMETCSLVQHGLYGLCRCWAQKKLPRLKPGGKWDCHHQQDVFLCGYDAHSSKQFTLTFDEVHTSTLTELGSENWDSR